MLHNTVKTHVQVVWFKNVAGVVGGTQLAQSVEPATLDLGVVGSSPMLGVEITKE